MFCTLLVGELFIRDNVENYKSNMKYLFTPQKIVFWKNLHVFAKSANDFPNNLLNDKVLIL